MTTPAPPTLRALARPGAVLAPLIACLACAASPHSAAGTLWLALADASCSVDPVAARAYEDAWRAVVDAARPGDRIVLLRARPGVYAATLPTVDATLPRAAGLLESSARAARTLAAVRARLHAVAPVDPTRCAPTSPLLESVAAAGRLLADDTRVPRLVVLSDMLEDSPEARFERVSPAPGDAVRLAPRWNEGGTDAVWARTTVHVVFAGRMDGRTARAVEAFWREYLGRLGATVRSYGAVLPTSATE